MYRYVIVADFMLIVSYSLGPFMRKKFSAGKESGPVKTRTAAITFIRLLLLKVIEDDVLISHLRSAFATRSFPSEIHSHKARFNNGVIEDDFLLGSEMRRGK